MNKKSYLIIGATILIFIIAIMTILLLGNNKTNSWIADIRNSQNYQITMIDCNGREKNLDNNVLDELSNKWNSLSNNGPWTGDTSSCYKSVTISYENNGIIKKVQILIIDDSSIVLDLNTNTIYYTNASEIIKHLNNLFI